MRGGPCAAGPSGKLGPPWRRGLNWPRCATSIRLTRSAAEGKPCRPRQGPGAEEETEDEKWTRLGEIRRVAATECWRGKGPLEVPPVRIARGPDVTQGFVLRRSNRETRRGDYKRQLVSVVKNGMDWLRSDFAVGIMAISFVTLFLLSFPWLGAAAGTYYALDSLGQFKPEVVYLVALIGEVAGGLVFALGVIDWSVDEISPLFNLACVGGFLPAGTLAFALMVKASLSRRQQSTQAIVGVTLGEEEEEEEEEMGGKTSCASSGNRYPEVYPSGLDPTKASAAATEAGRLRRRASAALQNKVFDPGR